MNEKFYSLPQERQDRMIRAGFRVFSQAPFKNCPMQEIADAAGISKPLLFHYFGNKLGLYLFLWEKAVSMTKEVLEQFGCYEPDDLFQMMELGMRAKLQLMKAHPEMTAFVVRAFYEKEPDICRAIQESYRYHFGIKAQSTINKIDTAGFVPGLDLQMMYREMYLASEGYLWEIFQRGEELDVERLEEDFQEMLRFWKQIYTVG